MPTRKPHCFCMVFVINLYPSHLKEMSSTPSSVNGQPPWNPKAGQQSLWTEPVDLLLSSDVKKMIPHDSNQLWKPCAGISIIQLIYLFCRMEKDDMAILIIHKVFGQKLRMIQVFHIFKTSQLLGKSWEFVREEYS